MRLAQLACLPIPEKAVVFLGDSLTQMGEWSELLPHLQVVNRGIGGETTTGLLKRLESLIKVNSCIIFLMIGINDLCLERKTPQELLTNYRQILTYLANFHQFKVYVQSILPVNKIGVKRFEQINQQIVFINQELQKLAAEFNYQYIDLFSHFADSNYQLALQYTLDGIHLNGQGYLLWSHIISEIALPNTDKL